MKLIIHRGAKQIGGSCIEISTETTRIILDVGAELKDPALLLGLPKKDERKRPANLPSVPGLFENGARVNAVVLSHAHGDHTGLLEWTRPEIPIYRSKGTSKMLMAGSMFARQTAIKGHPEITLVPGKPVKIGDITVTGLSVDHSAFDSLALLIEADGKRLLYSGDLRMHGRKPGMVDALYKFIAEKPIDVLLMEGTNLREPSASAQSGNQTEYELEDTLFQTITGWPNGLVLANFSPQHVDRFVSFYKATKRSGRVFVTDVYGAFVLHLASGQCRIPKPTAKNGIRVYYNQSFEKTWQRKNQEKTRNKFLADRIDLPTIMADPNRYVMLFRPSMMKLDFGGVFPPHTMCLYSFWPGYLVQPEYKALQSALNKADGKFLECHTSGHIFADDLVKFVKKVAPRKVIPVHTTMPDEFLKFFPNAKLLPDGIPQCV